MPRTDITNPTVHLLATQLEKFLVTLEYRSQWLETSKMKVYVRRSWRAFVPPELNFTYLGISGLKTNCLDIASVEVQENYQGKGFFREFMQFANKVNPYPAIYLETVISDKLKEYVKKHNYSEDVSVLDSYFKLKN